MTARPSVVRPVQTRRWRRAMADALFATLGRPETWAVSLLGLLVRGGLLLLLLPIVVVPTTPDLAIVVAPALVPLYFGQPSAALEILIVVIAAAVVGAIVVGGLLGAWADVALVGVALDEDDRSRSNGRAAPAHVVRSSFLIRLLAHLPLAIALVWGATRIVDATYAELVSPDDVTIPLVIRVLRDVPDAIGVIVVAWLLGEALGGVALRGFATGRTSARGALVWGASQLLRHPARSLGTFALSTVVVAAALVPALLAPAVAWQHVAVLLRSGAGLPDLLAGVAALVVLWLVGLVLVAATTAFRSYAWSFATVADRLAATASQDERAGGPGTIGGLEDGRPGEWPTSHVSGRL